MQPCLGIAALVVSSSFAHAQLSTLSPAQRTRADAVVAEAQCVIDSMPAGEHRNALQNALDDFEQMLEATDPPRVLCDPDNSLGPLGPLPHEAATRPEYVTPGESGSTSQVGQGGEVIILGSTSNQAQAPSLLGAPNGTGQKSQTTVTGGIFIHEGCRTSQSYTASGNGRPRNASEWVRYYCNEFECYWLHARYFEACAAKYPQNAAVYERFRQSVANSATDAVEDAFAAYVNGVWPW